MRLTNQLIEMPPQYNLTGLITVNGKHPTVLVEAYLEDLIEEWYARGHNFCYFKDTKGVFNSGVDMYYDVKRVLERLNEKYSPKLLIWWLENEPYRLSLYREGTTNPVTYYEL